MFVTETKGIWIKTQKKTKAGWILCLCSGPAQQTWLFFQLGIISSSCPKSWVIPDPEGGWQRPGGRDYSPPFGEQVLLFLCPSTVGGMFGKWRWGGKAEQVFRGGETDSASWGTPHGMAPKSKCFKLKPEIKTQENADKNPCTEVGRLSVSRELVLPLTC